MDLYNQKPTKDPVAEKVIKFDLKSDEKTRVTAKKSYEISKKFKAAGIKFRKLVPASLDSSIMSMFKIGPNNDLMCLEVNVSKTTPEEKELILNDIRDYFLTLDGVKSISDLPYKCDKVSLYHRFLFKHI